MTGVTHIPIPGSQTPVFTPWEKQHHKKIL